MPDPIDRVDETLHRLGGMVSEFAYEYFYAGHEYGLAEKVEEISKSWGFWRG